MHKIFVEFISTFFLVLTIAVAAVAGSAGSLAPFAIAAVLMVLIYAGGPVSGAHYNPAVTLGAIVRGKIQVPEAAAYMAAQLLGALLATIVAKLVIVFPDPSLIAHDPVRSLLAEFLFTFALVWVIFGVATTKAAAGKGYFGLAIAGTVLAGALTVGSVSGGAFNPAVAFALSLLGVSSWGDIWIYLVANFAGGVTAALAANAFYDREG